MLLEILLCFPCHRGGKTWGESSTSYIREIFKSCKIKHTRMTWLFDSLLIHDIFVSFSAENMLVLVSAQE